MVVTLHQPAEELRQLMNLKDYRPIRDRLLAVLLAGEGRSAPAIAKLLHRSRRWVQWWVYRYRDEGLGGLENRPKAGKPSKLKLDQQEAFEARIEAGPVLSDGVCRLAGTEIQRILAREFQADYSLNGTYRLLHRLGYSCLRPRPKHRKSDPAAQEAFKEAFPLFVRTSKTNTRTGRWRSGSKMKAASASKAL